MIATQDMLMIQSLCEHIIPVTGEHQVPAIAIRSDVPAMEVTTAVNFLRSGQSAVQLLFVRGSTDAECTVGETCDLFKKLTLPGERFTISGTVKCGTNFVLRVEREILPEVVRS